MISPSRGLSYYYEQLWHRAEIDGNRLNEARAIYIRMQASYSHYDYVARQVCPAMPWWLVAIIHELECGGRFDRMLHNGERLPGPTVLWPSGRGPFDDWQHAAIDAIKIKMDRTTDSWSWRYAWQVLAFLEAYNGWGYLKYHPEVPSPYLWAATTISTENGKYIKDGVWSPGARTDQIGAAALIKVHQQETSQSGYMLDEPNLVSPTLLRMNLFDFGSDAARERRAPGWFETIRLQQFMNSMPREPHMAPLKIDGDFGPKSAARFENLTGVRVPVAPPGNNA